MRVVIIIILSICIASGIYESKHSDNKSSSGTRKISNPMFNHDFLISKFGERDMSLPILERNKDIFQYYLGKVEYEKADPDWEYKDFGTPERKHHSNLEFDFVPPVAKDCLLSIMAIEGDYQYMDSLSKVEMGEYGYRHLNDWFETYIKEGNKYYSYSEYSTLLSMLSFELRERDWAYNGKYKIESDYVRLDYRDNDDLYEKIINQDIAQIDVLSLIGNKVSLKEGRLDDGIGNVVSLPQNQIDKLAKECTKNIEEKDSYIFNMFDKIIDSFKESDDIVYSVNINDYATHYWWNGNRNRKLTAKTFYGIVLGLAYHECCYIKDYIRSGNKDFEICKYKNRELSKFFYTHGFDEFAENYLADDEDYDDKGYGYYDAKPITSMGIEGIRWKTLPDFSINKDTSYNKVEKLIDTIFMTSYSDKGGLLYIEYPRKGYYMDQELDLIKERNKGMRESIDRFLKNRELKIKELKNKIHKAIEDHNKKINDLNKLLDDHKKQGIENLIKSEINFINTGNFHDKIFDLEYDEKRKKVEINYHFPVFSDFPRIKEIKDENTDKISYFSDKEAAPIYRNYLLTACIKIMYELYKNDENFFIDGITFNGIVTSIDKRFGTERTDCIFAITTKKKDMEKIVLKNIEPEETFKALKGKRNKIDD